MPETTQNNPAEIAAASTRDRIRKAIDEAKHFRVEAGAGAGKTYSLIDSLNYLIEKKGSDFVRQHQQVACITFTNVASNEITRKIDGHPAILSSTIHSFLWSVIGNFQSNLRTILPTLRGWTERLETIGVRSQKIGYDDLGRRSVTEFHISIGHADVLLFACELLKEPKFRTLLSNRYPILLIDEYQDTDIEIVEAIKTNILDIEGRRPLIGFFGDHWQKIYGEGCGSIEHPELTIIDKQSNFRSAPIIVDSLNRMRPELMQMVSDPEAIGSVEVFHTNRWVGQRRTGQHWGGDLPQEDAHRYLLQVKEKLTQEGWDFEQSKILMLTHNTLASEQGYRNLADVFPFNDSYVKKQDAIIAFLLDVIEPACIAYKNKKYGEMFASLGGRSPVLQSISDKSKWATFMDKVIELRSSSKIGALFDHFQANPSFISLPQKLIETEQALASLGATATEDEKLNRHKKLREVAYTEVIALDRFIDGFTPFSTKHGVKGAQFENVLVVIGRGWNQYNFDQFLQWASNPNLIPSDKRETFERNRNLFYVACSRPKKRLAILFTQLLSQSATATLSRWFGADVIHEAPSIN